MRNFFFHVIESHLKLSIKYISLASESEILVLQVQIFLEVLFGSCVQDSFLERSTIWIPIHKDEFADGHVVLINELKVKNSISVSIFRQSIEEVLPGLVFIADFFDNLDKGVSTMCSASMA